MADIAMLVAEEYERRTKSSKRGNEGEESSLGSGVKALAQRIGGFSWVKKIEEEKVEFAKRFFMEPKSTFGVLAINGFFSA